MHTNIKTAKKRVVREESGGIIKESTEKRKMSFHPSDHNVGNHIKESNQKNDIA